MKEFYKNLPIIKYLFFVVGICLFGSGLITLLQTKGISAFVCVVLGAIFIAGALFYDTFVNSERTPTRILRYIVVLGTCLWLLACLCLLIYGNAGKPSYTEDVLIIMGGSDDSKPTKSIEKRMDIAVEYLKTNPYAYVVISGESSMGVVTEADVMVNYLRNHEIDQSRIIRSTKADNLKEKIKQIKKLIDSRIDGEYRCITITNASRALRTQLIARRCGLRTNIVGVKSDFLRLPVTYMHETLALIRLLFLKY